ncbi:MAG TPA: hypothetical protein VMX12_01405, partial [Acidimicrobiia bacterium]|nr:hypothetical protein [Acidimicrobiia bacterium]
MSTTRRAASSARRVARAGRCATQRVALLLLSCAGLFALPVRAAPPPGTAIDNQATATFTQMSAPIVSNAVRTTVLAQIGVLLQADRNATADPGDIVALPHTLTNTGTASDIYTITFQDAAGDDFDFASLLLFIDANANGVRDSGEVTLTSGDVQVLAAGAQLALVVLAEVPATATGGQIGRLQITATGTSPSTTDTNTDSVTVAAPPAPPAIGFFTDASFGTSALVSPVDDPLFVEGRAASCNLDPLAVETSQLRLRAQLTSDDETFAAVETGPDTGVFRILPSVPTADAARVPVVAGNGVMETQGGDTITASIVDCASGTPVDVDIRITSAGQAPTGVLFIEKRALRDYVEIGEWVDYAVEIRNAGNAALADVALEDRLPGGFRYQEGSAQLDGHSIDDPAGGAGRGLRFDIGAIGPDQGVELRYRALVGPGAAKSGDAVNRAQAVAGSLRSNIASA